MDKDLIKDVLQVIALLIIIFLFWIEVKLILAPLMFLK